MAMRAELDKAHAEAAALSDERDALRTQLDGTQEVLVAEMMAAQEELVAQQTETQLQLQTRWRRRRRRPEVCAVLVRSLKHTRKERVALTPLSTLARAP